MIQGKKLITITLISLSLFIALYQLVLFINSFESSEYLFNCFGFVYLILVLMWIDLDSKEQKDIYRPHDYGFFMFIYWIPYLPYYFIKTRGAKGVLFLLGLIVLLNLGFILQWAYYLVFNFA
jgi:uncharacterized metal-binding protein